tara:strand:+ start:1764 stop:2027 length:264 start_codon:yes stop_codon:yes gene_type:complete
MGSLDEIGMQFSCNVFDDFICRHNGRVTSSQIQKDFNIKARLFDQFMTERILPNYCTFFSSYGKICKNDEFYIFPKLGDDICPHCLK